MIRRVLAIAAVFGFVVGSFVVNAPAEEKSADPRQVMISVRVIATDKTDVEVVKLMLSVAGGTSQPDSSDGCFVTLLDTDALDKIATGLVKLNKAKVLAEPKLVTLNGRSASFLSGGEFPIRTTAAPAGERQEPPVAFRSFGTWLTLIPQIKGNLIELDIASEISQLVSAEIPGGVPGLQTRSVRSKIQVQPNQTIVMGGEFATNPNSANQAQVGIPLNLPNIGKIFQNKRGPNNSRLLICVSAEIIEPATAIEDQPTGIPKPGPVPFVASENPSNSRVARYSSETQSAARSEPAYFHPPAALTVQPIPRTAPSLPTQQYVTQARFEPDDATFPAPRTMPNEFQSAQPVSDEARLENMRTALVHLQAAGLDEQAASVQAEITKLVRTTVEQKLKQKSEELKQLQSEISILRQAIGSDDE